MSWWGKCVECETVQEVSHPSWYDGPDMCDECLAMDTIKEIESDEEESA